MDQAIGSSRANYTGPSRCRQAGSNFSRVWSRVIRLFFKMKVSETQIALYVAFALGRRKPVLERQLTEQQADPKT